MDLIVVVAAIVTAILSGLIPGLPAWISPFLLLPFLHDLTTAQIVQFWIISVAGSQFFGSISSIMFGIPGENSTLVYIDSVRNLTFSDKAQLIKLTADAGFIASVISFVLGITLMDWSLTNIKFLNTTWFTFGILFWISLIIVAIYYRTIFTSLALFIIGVVIGGNGNIALPSWWIQLNQWFYDVSVINLIVGLILIPSISKLHHTTTNTEPITNNFLPSTIVGTMIGIVSGFLAGPTATISSLFAWRSRKTLGDRVIAVEAANNSVIVIGAFVFLLLQVPLALDQITVNQSLIQKGWTDDLSMILSLQNYLTMIIAIGIIWILSRNSSPFYQIICQRSNTIVITVLLSLSLIWIDFYSAQGSYNLINYGIWLSVFSIIGWQLQKFKRSAIPMVFGFILGEQLIWTTFQILQ